MESVIQKNFDLNQVPDPLIIIIITQPESR